MARFDFSREDEREPGASSLFRQVERAFDNFSRRSRAVLPAWTPGALAPRIDVSEDD